MHKGGWVHRDLKPCNIGVVGQPSRAVLLDLGTSERIPQNGSLFPEQGCVGTVNYIAPEMERRNYNHSVDIWSMGVILYCLTYNHHPWEMAENPWSPCSCQCIMPEGSLLICEKHDLMQHKFMVSYELAIDRMLGDYELARKNPIEGYIHREYFIDLDAYGGTFNELTPYLLVGGLFACMVSYDRARYNASPRSTIEEALGHPVWGLLRSNELGRMKKPRLTLDGLEVRQGPQS
ncbi:kinase-like domain-containing protein [Xylaria venustula]|nr:kinase-like domain-containing protein [Xylaria venustula]